MTTRGPPPSPARRALDALNFFAADVRDGLGPFLAMYLLTVQKWDEASIGVVMSAAALAGIAVQTPAGALVDMAKAKRAIVVFACVLVTASSLALLFVTSRSLVIATQSIAAAAGAVFAPAIAALTLGIAGPKAFAKNIGRNEGFNHAGNAFAAGLAALLGYSFGPTIVFWLMAAMTIMSIVSVLFIPADAIDNDLARGLAHAQDEKRSPLASWRILLSNRPLLIFAVCNVVFHFANAAMLPLVGQKLALQNAAAGTSLMGVCIVAAQMIMIPVALFSGAKADTWGRKPIFLAAFAVLTLRGLLYPLLDNAYWLVGVQFLDGVGAGIFGALFPVVVADLTRGSGHFNVSLGAIATATGIGAAFSTAMAGYIVVAAGYNAAFLALAASAGLGLLFYAVAMPETKDDNAGAPVRTSAKPSLPLI